MHEILHLHKNWSILFNFLCICKYFGNEPEKHENWPLAFGEVDGSYRFGRRHAALSRIELDVRIPNGRRIKNLMEYLKPAAQGTILKS